MTKFFLPGLAALVMTMTAGAQSSPTNFPAWLTRPLSLIDALNTALEQNAAIVEAKNDLETSRGLVVETRAVALPQLQATSQYKYTQPSDIQPFTVNGYTISTPDQNWNAGIQLVQSIYLGGRLTAAFRAATATEKQALANYETSVADALLNVRLAYYDVLLAAQEITVHEASVNLLDKELADQQQRLKAGTVPRFNVLRAQVAVANERPNLIQARNNYRIAKNNLANVLGYNLPHDVWEDIPLNLTDGFDDTPFQIDLPDAIQQALTRRSELLSLRKNVELQQLNIINAKSGYKPSVSVFAGYNWFNEQYPPSVESQVSLNNDFSGWNAGAQLSWNIFDGLLTPGKVKQARAQYDKSRTVLEDQSRQIELQVRTVYSDLIQARETLDSQRTVQEEAEEALREARQRAEAGTGTQLDVLDAETSLTQARTTQIQAMHDYSTARARFERAVGADLKPVK
jgi:TolC family type I secretion outer membrane protein